MGQFKPMVKMMTTEPSVELKLKKGGKVEKKMQMGGDPMGGMPMRTTGAAPRPPVVQPGPGVGPMPGSAPKKPSMMDRLKAMKAKMMAGRPSGPVSGRPMKEGGESKSEHAAEMKKMAKTADALKEHAGKPASKAHKGLKTGGVVNGQGGFKKGGKVMKKAAGGIIPESASERGAEQYATGNVTTAQHGSKSGSKTGGVKMGNGGGYKKGGAACYATGGVAKANGGGYKKGGAAKKFADGGMSGSAPVSDRERQLGTDVLGAGYMSDEERRYLQEQVRKSMKPEGSVTEVEREVVRKIPMNKPVKKYAAGGSVNDSGKAEKMPARRVPTPVSINQLSGTYKKGGMVMTPAQKRLNKTFESENAPAMKAAKKMTNEKYGRK